MATRSRIGILKEDDMTVESVYCHWDGYLANNGRILHDNWTSLELVKRLVEGGDVSSLGTSPEDTIYYHRDMKRDESPSVVHPFTTWPNNGQDFEYVFVPSRAAWIYRTWSDPWTDLRAGLEGEKTDGGDID